MGGWRLALVAAAAAAGAVAGAWSAASAQGAQRHNVILFVADGLRSEIVDAQTAPAFEAVRREGVDLRNSHSLFPTVTTANASALATGHYLGDTGDFGNFVYVGQTPLAPPSRSGVAAVMEDNTDLDELEARFGGNFLSEQTLLSAARAAGYQTAAVGKLGPVAIHGVDDRSNPKAIVIDDGTGRPPPAGIALPPDLVAAIRSAGLPTTAPGRGDNGDTGTFERPGTRVANLAQQDWFVEVATRVLLPRFKATGRPFAMVFWSRDPDGTQHGQGDSLNQLAPGINGPTSMAAVRNASDDLQRLRDALKALGLDKTTDIVVVADHGFATISRQSRTSQSRLLAYRDTVPGFLPAGFLATDLSLRLGLPVWSARGQPVVLKDGVHAPAAALIGMDPAHPDIVVVNSGGGGSDLIYLTGPDPKNMAHKIADFVMGEDYTGAVFVDERIDRIPGALPTGAVNLAGGAKLPAPSMVVSFRSESTGCPKPETCVVIVGDGGLQEGQGGHGSFSRAETHNFMAAVGPDFKSGFVDPAPVSNADIAWTIAKAVGIEFKSRGSLRGRVIVEALKGGQVPAFEARTLRSDKGPGGFQTVLDYQQVGQQKYFDAAGMPGRVFGVKP